MRPMLPRPIAWMAKLCFAVACLLTPSIAAAQFVTPTGVMCGEEEISFDTLNVPTEGANATRRRELNKLHSYAVAAWYACTEGIKPYPTPACDFQSGVACAANRLPGCAFVEAWLKTHLVKGWPDAYAPRAELRALDAELPGQALRVLAHQSCEKSTARLPETCVDLAAAEALAKGVQLCPATEDEVGDALPLVDRKKSKGDINTLRVARDACNKGPCSVDQQQHMVTLERAGETAGARLYYGSPDAGCPSKTNATKRIDEVITHRVALHNFDRPAIFSLPPQSVLAMEGAALKAQSDPTHQKGCRASTYYVAPTGVLTTKELERGEEPTLCIDAGSFAIDRPFEVQIAVYPSYKTRKAPRGIDDSHETQSSSHVPTYTRAVWPGEQIPLDDALKSALGEGPTIVRITIRGYPRGISLRQLAQRGENDTKQSKSYEASDLRAEARKVIEGATALAEAQAKAKALDALAASLVVDKRYQEKRIAMDEAIEQAKDDKAETMKAAHGKIQAAVEQIRSFLDAVSQRPENAGKAAVGALVQARNALPKVPLPTETKTVADLRKAQASVIGYKGALDDAANKVRAEVAPLAQVRDVLDRKLTRLCRISKQLIPVIDEDILIANTASGAYVIDYDWEAGFQRAPARALDESARVFIRVRRVRHGGAIAVAIADKGVVQHAVSLLGTSTAAVARDQTATMPTDPALVNGGRSGVDELNPEDVLVQGHSTQILVLPGLDGAKRYQYTLCGLSKKDQACPPPDGAGEKARVIARASVVVHSRRFLGVRAGFGFSLAFGGEVRSLADVPGSSTLKYVRATNPTLDTAVPLLLTLYPLGRDAVDFPKGASGGLVAGLDMVKLFKVEPRLYLGGVLDLSGFGLTAALTVEGRNSVDAAEGRYLTRAGSTMRFYPGAFLGITTDLDIFETVFRKYIVGNDLPVLGNGGKQ